MKLRKLFNDKPILWVAVLFLLSAAARYILSICTVHMPTVYIDEGLYINIARSLFYEGKVLYRAQPITYVYLGYPIVLMPLFLLPASVSLYRAVQVYNALLISSSVFPAYLLGKKTGLPTGRAILVAAFTALIPELALSSFLTAESLYYPLMIWSFYLAACVTSSEEGTKKHSLILAVLTGFTYFVKPVCVIFGACFFVLEFILSLKNKNKKGALLNAGCLGIAVAVIGLGYVLYGALFGSTTVLNLYEKQFTDTTAKSIPVMFQSVLYHVVGFTFACGGAFVLLPWFSADKLDSGRRRLLLALTLGLLASIIGVAVAVVPYNYTGSGFTSPIHLRYLMFFFPPVFAFFLSEENVPGRIKNKKAAIITLIAVTVLTVFPSAFRFFNYQAGTFDSPALNAFYKKRIESWVGIILLVLSVNNMALTVNGILKNKGRERIIRNCCILLALFFTVNGTCNYLGRRTEDRSFEKGATKVAEYLADVDNALVVTNNHYDDFRSFHLDSHLRKPLKMVVMNDVLLNTLNYGGRYVPWTPVVQAPNTANDPTPDVDTLVFDLETSNYVEFADSVETQRIGNYLVAKIRKDLPFLKTAIASMDGYTLPKDSVGSLLIYDETMLARPTVTLTLTMRSTDPSGCNVHFTSGGQSETVAITGQPQEYTVTLPIASNGFYEYSFTADTDIVISAYHTA